MSLVCPFPRAGAPDPSKDPIFGFLALSNADAQPFRHVPSSITSLMDLTRMLPTETMTDREDGIDAWKTWFDSGEFKRSAEVWAEKDDFCAWGGMAIFPGLLEETAKEVLRESASFESLNGRAWVAKLLSKLQEPCTSRHALERGIGREPSNRGASYEEWFAYDRSKGAENYEDWWKAGGRERIAETKDYHDWNMRDVVLRRCWPLFLQILVHLVDEKNGGFVEKLRVVDRNCRERLGAYMEKYQRDITLEDDRMTKPYAAYLKSSISAALQGKDPDEAVLQKVASSVLSADFGGDPRGLEWYDALFRLKSDPQPGEYHFPSTLNGYKRALVRQLAQKLGLKSHSEGVDTKSPDGRKQKKRAEKKGETVIARHVVVKNH